MIAERAATVPTRSFLIKKVTFAAEPAEVEPDNAGPEGARPRHEKFNRSSQLFQLFPVSGLRDRASSSYRIRGIRSPSSKFSRYFPSRWLGDLGGKPAAIFQ
ncbi:MAG: hypothetical protein ACTSUE_15460 [Promethearchaeota archaeon]